jgi:integrase
VNRQETCWLTGWNPGVIKKVQKEAGLQETETFEMIAREWFAKFSPSWASSHATKIIRRFELYIFPWIGSRPIKSITAPQLLAVLRRIEAKGILETAHRAQQNCGQVFRYAVATGRAERDRPVTCAGLSHRPTASTCPLLPTLKKSPGYCAQ